MAKVKDELHCAMRADTTGVMWDLILYVPTVGFLLLWGMKFWYGADDQAWMGYGLMFLGFFFLMVGGNRVLGRLLILPSSPVSIDVNRERIQMELKNGASVALVKGIRFFSDYAGKSFALTGTDQKGAERKYIFHRKQFDEDAHADLMKVLDKYK
ncbi:MAG: hypothetical protein HQM07_06000 [Zetaproteobacteria bacterium]|nr:hypothetical protein [Zetaproteobacteria bacterium]